MKNLIQCGKQSITFIRHLSVSYLTTSSSVHYGMHVAQTVCMETEVIHSIPLPLVFLCPPPALLPPPTQSGSRRSNFSSTPRRQQQQQNSANSMMQPQHGGHGQQESLPSHCVSPMSQGAGVSGQPDPHQVGIRSKGCGIVMSIAVLLS